MWNCHSKNLISYELLHALFYFFVVYHSPAESLDMIFKFTLRICISSVGPTFDALLLLMSTGNLVRLFIKACQII